MAIQSVAMAAQNLLLMAHVEGLGACWLCAPLFCQETVREALGLPDDYEPQGLIALGYPDETRDKTRKPLTTRVVFR
jgi:nitroreductase